MYTPLTTAFSPLKVSNMLNKLHGQPDSYDKKHVSSTSPQECANQPAEQSIGLVELSAQVHMVLSGKPIRP
jgi:hypothetical protein